MEVHSVYRHCEHRYLNSRNVDSIDNKANLHGLHSIIVFFNLSLFHCDLERISAPTKPLLHQSARFWYFIDGEGTIEINNEEHRIKKNSFVAILPWMTTYVTKVEKELVFYNVIYNEYILSYIRTVCNTNNEFLQINTPIDEYQVVNLNDEDGENIRSIFL